MRRRHRHHHNPFPPYTDLMMCIVGVTALIMSALLIRPVSESVKDFHPKAEYLVTLTWDDNKDVDLDLWLTSPSGDVVYYGNKELPNIALDRDSLGKPSNSSKNPDGTVAVSGNQEIIAIRAIMPGFYVVSVNYYAGRDENGQGYALHDARIPTPFKIELLKVNPKISVVSSYTGTAASVYQTQNVIAFTVLPDGTIKNEPLPPDDYIRRHFRSH